MKIWTHQKAGKLALTKTGLVRQFKTKKEADAAAKRAGDGVRTVRAEVITL